VIAIGTTSTAIVYKLHVSSSSHIRLHCCHIIYVICHDTTTTTHTQLLLQPLERDSKFHGHKFVRRKKYKTKILPEAPVVVEALKSSCQPLSDTIIIGLPCTYIMPANAGSYIKSAHQRHEERGEEGEKDAKQGVVTY